MNATVQPTLHRALALLAMTLSLAGCASFSGIEAQFKQMLPTRVGASDAPLSPAIWPKTDWWLAYDDPVLNELIAKALADNPNLQAAEARLSRARANADSAEAARWPRLDLDIDSMRHRFSENADIPPPLAGEKATLSHARLNGSWEIDFFGRNRAALDAALGQARAAEADAQAARILLASDLARRYFRLAALLEQRRIAENTLKQRSDIFALVRSRVDAGLDSGVELKQAEGSLPEIRRDLGNIDEQIALTRHAIAALTGQPPDAAEQLAPRLSETSIQALPSAIPVDLIARRADLSAARWRVEAATRAIDSAKAAFYPNINLIGLSGFSSLGISNWFKTESHEWGIGGAIHLPIFDAGRLRANLRATTADADAAVASYNATLIDAVREVADDVASQKAIAQQLREQADALKAAEAAFEFARQRYAAGIGNYLSVLTAETNVLAQRKTNTELKARHIDNNLLLIRALGGGYAAS